MLEYEDPVAAAYALRKHGEVVGGRWILGVRVGDVGSPSAAPPPDWSVSQRTGHDGGGRQIGTPIRVQQNASVLKAPSAGGNGAKPAQRDEGYGWGEEDEGKGNWILEKLVRFLLLGYW